MECASQTRTRQFFTWKCSKQGKSENVFPMAQKKKLLRQYSPLNFFFFKSLDFLFHQLHECKRCAHFKEKASVSPDVSVKSDGFQSTVGHQMSISLSLSLTVGWILCLTSSLFCSEAFLVLFHLSRCHTCSLAGYAATEFNVVEQSQTITRVSSVLEEKINEVDLFSE